MVPTLLWRPLLADTGLLGARTAHAVPLNDSEDHDATQHDPLTGGSGYLQQMGTGTGNHIGMRDQSAIKKRAPAHQRLFFYRGLRLHITPLHRKTTGSHLGM